MSICRPGVESGISASLTSPQVLPVQLVYRVAGGGARGGRVSEAETHNQQELCGIRKPGNRTEGRRWWSVRDLFKSKRGLDGLWW